MEAHAKKFGLEIVQEDVRGVEKTDEGFSIATESGTVYTCRSIILAGGASPVKLGIPGELQLAGKGVSYCAVCDGPFFRDLEVAVVGGGDSAVEEAAYLARFSRQSDAGGRGGRAAIHPRVPGGRASGLRRRRLSKQAARARGRSAVR